MYRREFLIAAGAPLAARATGYRDYSRCLPDHLRALAEDAYQRRNAALAAITSPEAIRARQQWARETFWRLIGGQPERTPLRARLVGAFKRPGYRVEKIVYESRPRFHIPANLYIPSGGKPPHPGVLFQMGHSLNGKAAAPYQKCCQGLARLGYVVLAFDPMGQGERTYYPRPGGTLTRLGSADDEHTVPGKQLLLAGETSTRVQVWDAVRSLDYLAAHPMVDPGRLASTGQSGGGTLTMLLAAVDDRLAAAAISCANTENLACADFNPPGSTDDAEQNLLASGPAGFDRWDTLYPLTPKPLLVLVSAKDFFGTYSPRYIANGQEEFGKLRRMYEILGAADRIGWRETPLGHSLSYELRMEIYRWFGRWLQGDARPVGEEPPVEVERDETLWAAESGNVVRSFGGLTPYQLAREAAARIATPQRPGGIESLLGVVRPAAGLGAAVLGRSPSRHCDVEAIEVRTAEQVWAPAWLFVPKRPDRARPLIVALEPAGRNPRSLEDGLWQQLAGEGFLICAPDVRGSGDLTPEFPRGAAGHGRSHQEEENYAWASLMLGQSLVGQRVTDLLAVAAAMRAHPAAEGRRLVVAASGKMTVPALFAGALEPSIAALYLAGGLASFRSLLEAEDYAHPLANFVPGILGVTDLPQLAASMAPRRVRWAAEARWDREAFFVL